MWLLDTGLATARERLRRLPDILRLLTVGLLGSALADPIVVCTGARTERGGLDMVLPIGASGSMLAQDLAPNRFDAASLYNLGNTFGETTHASGGEGGVPIGPASRAFRRSLHVADTAIARRNLSKEDGVGADDTAGERE